MNIRVMLPSLVDWSEDCQDTLIQQSFTKIAVKGTKMHHAHNIQSISKLAL